MYTAIELPPPLPPPPPPPPPPPQPILAGRRGLGGVARVLAIERAVFVAKAARAAIRGRVRRLGDRARPTDAARLAVLANLRREPVGTKNRRRCANAISTTETRLPRVGAFGQASACGCGSRRSSTCSAGATGPAVHQGDLDVLEAQRGRRALGKDAVDRLTRRDCRLHLALQRDQSMPAVPPRSTAAMTLSPLTFLMVVRPASIGHPRVQSAVFHPPVRVMPFASLTLSSL